MSGYSVTLEGQPPWGFRLQGGKDFNMPLTVSRVTAGSKSAQANMSSGDVVTAIDGVSTAGMTHLEAQNKIKASIGNLKLGLQRGKRPAPVPTATPIIESAPIVVPHQKALRAAAAAHPHTPPPHVVGVGAMLGGGASVALAQYNTPVLLYSRDAIANAVAGQARAMGSEIAGYFGPPKEVVVDTSTPVFQAVARREATARGDGPSTADEDWANKNSTAQSRSFKILAQITGTHDAQKQQQQQQQQKQQQQKAPKEKPNGPVTKPVAYPRRANSSVSVSPIRHVEPSRRRSSAASSLSAWGAAAPPSYSFSLSLGAKPSVAYPFSHAASAASPPSRSSTPAPPSPAAAVPPPPPPPLLLPGDGASLAPRSLVGAAPQCPPSSSFSAATQPRSLASSNSPVSGLLVQRAEHVPEALRAPFCNKCNNIIRGPFIVALGRSWHKDHFNCCHCNSCLADTGFVVEAGKVYCQGCYGMFFAPPCGKCSQKIVGEITYALKQAWHSNCFVCACCSQPIGQGVFHMEDGDPYCEKDFFRLFSTKCEGCDFPVEAGDRYVEALGHTWHDTCFVCTVCQVNLEGQPFYSKKNKPLCKKHANSINI
ncbi:unnamed protein product [Lampetra fluviatilis]